MRAKIRRFWESRAPREQAVVVILTAILGAALYLWLVQSASRARGPLKATVTALRAQAARLEQQAAEHEQLRAKPPATASRTDLRALVQAQAGAAGLARALVRVDALDVNRVQVVFGAVAFADWLNWVEGLQLQQVRLDACRIEAQSRPGLVSVTGTLVRARSH